jgi:hypothetical protein
VEQALELGVPVLPIPDAGGDSRDLLDKYRERIAASFGEQAINKCLAEVSHAINTDPGTAAAAALDLIGTAKVGRCLVLQPYDDEHNSLYTERIEPAVAKHMIPVRLDRLPTSKAIYDSFADAILSCSAIIADITVLNQNVMYEIGYARGRGLTPLLYVRETITPPQLPVYFRTLNVRQASAETPLEALISEYLLSLSASRRFSQMATGELP